jgi:uncharacterized phiE125 gp8 family phage protein
MFKVTTYPSIKGLSVAEAKSHLNILDDSFDSLIGQYIDTAQELLIKEASVIAQPATLKCWLQEWHDVDVFYDPINIITVTYYDINGNEQTLASSEYKEYKNAFPYFILFDGTLPSLDDRADPITIEIAAGYTTTPERIKQALRMMVADMFEVRQSDSYTSVNEYSKSTQHYIQLISRRVWI